jgi:hypothetical protein
MNKYHFTALVVGSSLAIAGSVVASSAFAGPDGDKADGKASHGPGARFNEIDSNKDGKLSLAELTAARESWFARLDTNKDGVITQAEIAASFAARRQEHLTKMFERDDVNRDGRVTRAESHLPSAWFELADANKDGTLTLQELTQWKAPARANGQSEHQMGRWNRFDENGDGKIERKELDAAVARQFARVDKNGDGSVTSDEFGAMRGHFRGRHQRGPHDEGSPAAAPAPTRS